MTLIISVSTENRVISASDRLVTLPDGSVFDSKTNKTVLVWASDAIFFISYTGAALVGNIQTQEWLGGYLTEIKAPELPFGEVISRITDRSSRDWTSFSTAYLTMSVSGFHGPRAVSGMISNFENLKGQTRPPSSTFEAQFIAARDNYLPGARPLALSIWGRASKVPESVKLRIKSLRKKHYFHNARSSEIAERLVGFIRETSKVLDSRVGMDCLSVVVYQDRRKDVESVFHGFGNDSVVYGPYLVHPMGSAKDITAQLPPGWDVCLFPPNDPSK